MKKKKLTMNIERETAIVVFSLRSRRVDLFNDDGMDDVT